MKGQENELNIVEMRTVLWMSGHAGQDKVGNECIREKVGIAFIVKKMIESYL